MKRLTPAAVTSLMVVVVGLLVTAYFARILIAVETKSAPLSRHFAGISSGSQQVELPVAPGLRGVTISSADGPLAANGFLRAGEFVDVHLTSKKDAGGDMTARILSGVRLLAINGGDSTKSVTLELSPEQANRLILARSKGSIALSYNPEGRGEAASSKNRERVTLEDLLSGESGKKFTVESYKGSKKSTLEFRETAGAGDQNSADDATRRESPTDTSRATQTTPTTPET